jgi:hypothetical protein
LLNYLIDHEVEFELNDYINILNIHDNMKGNTESVTSLQDNIKALTSILENKQNKQSS